MTSSCCRSTAANAGTSTRRRSPFRCPSSPRKRSPAMRHWCRTGPLPCCRSCSARATRSTFRAGTSTPPRPTSSARSTSRSACSPRPPTTSYAMCWNCSPARKPSAGRFRSAVPTSSCPRWPESLPKQPQWLQSLPAGAAREAVAARVSRRGGPEPLGMLATEDALVAFDKETSVRPRHGLPASLAADPSGRLLLKLADREISLPAPPRTGCAGAARAALPGDGARPARRRRPRACPAAAARRGGDGRLAALADQSPGKR